MKNLVIQSHLYQKYKNRIAYKVVIAYLYFIIYKFVINKKI